MSSFAKLTGCTITGADDFVDPADLIRLSRDYPLAEWGILVGSHEGTSRFPSLDWIRKFVDLRMSAGCAVPISLHVCGRHLRDMLEGRSFLFDILGARLYAFTRLQLNFHGERPTSVRPAEKILDALCRLFPEPDTSIIFQLDGKNDELAKETSRRFLVEGLFDVSHGAGVVPSSWPKSRSDMRCGWAGGLGPGNLREELPKIHAQAVGAYWVDMETAVRDDRDRLILESVEECLRIATAFAMKTDATPSLTAE